MFWKRHESVMSKLGRYFDECDQCFALFEKAIKILLETGHGPAFEEAAAATHESESKADDLRRDIELELYGKALLPESRGDLLGLLENYDLIPTAAEMVLFDLMCQRVVIPPELLAGFRRLIEINLEAYYLVRKTVDALLHNPKVTLHAVKEVDAKESESDRLERQLVRQIFATALDKGDKLELRNLVFQIGRISDLAEQNGDRIGIIAIKRQI